MIRTAPIWQNDITDQLMAGILKPVDLIESSVELSLQERKNLKLNLEDTGPKPNYQRFLTIYKLEDIPSEYHPNFFTMVDKFLRLEKRYGFELCCTSFFRSLVHHLKVYAAKGITDPEKIPMKSWHLFCWAGDLVPLHKPIAHFLAFLTEAILEEFDVWMEHELDTPKWGHLQGMPYASWVIGKSRKYRIKK